VDEEDNSLRLSGIAEAFFPEEKLDLAFAGPMFLARTVCAGTVSLFMPSLCLDK